MSSKTTSGYAVITGAGGGIGKNSCFSFAESGASGILLADLSLSSAQTAAQECKSYAFNPDCLILSIHIDVTDESAPARPPLSEFDHILSTNTCGTLLCNRAMLLQEPLSYQGRYTTRSLERGCTVNLSSANSVVAFPGKTAHTTAKHAVVGITKSGAVDYAPYNIRINAICPTGVAGPMNTHEAALNPHFEHMVQAVVPLKRVAQPDEVADAIHFLCSLAATYITGATLIVDAGSGLTVRLF
ncbi:putative short-chain dehydrogenase reductase family protein [Botrytis fragariae]|uniref:Putative short-chain dehydrogenase reductase family protein n=1 Tax=Botrytis fragariae TaxID=1964551 RepID=A0A8H6AQ12_9HELO|nr:putative short-chain dehydrogenase reductase family protein [Botrytis fragariae]KAF5871691.1 putative short-chain dehydrogenase reductase family protein [Botrytis fragariae]